MDPVIYEVCLIVVFLVRLLILAAIVALLAFVAVKVYQTIKGA